mmetsp:Transcript_70844/g.188482  ORF Transcript_70844/g.188482 Transcript_70844/m.188482 type:complete len:207 (+) Transcript_70844:408-1028(+)
MSRSSAATPPAPSPTCSSPTRRATPFCRPCTTASTRSRCSSRRLRRPSTMTRRHPSASPFSTRATSTSAAARSASTSAASTRSSRASPMTPTRCARPRRARCSTPQRHRAARRPCVTRPSRWRRRRSRWRSAASSCWCVSSLATSRCCARAARARCSIAPLSAPTIASRCARRACSGRSSPLSTRTSSARRRRRGRTRHSARPHTT